MQIFFLFFLRFIPDVNHFYKSLLNLSQYCFSFMFWLFGRGILTPQPGMVPSPSALESKVLTTGLPRKSPNILKD